MTAVLTSPATPPPTPQKPRKIFLLIGTLAALALGIGLFTSVGTRANSGPPHAGDRVPTFSGPRLNGTGSVRVPADGGSDGHPAVLLFFGDWCTICHSEIPKLAAAVRAQSHAGGRLSGVRVIGVDSEDTTAQGQAFVAQTGITFPVARDPNLNITSGAFYFEGDPYAVFVNGDGTIARIVPGPLSVAAFTRDEEQLGR